MGELSLGRKNMTDRPTNRRTNRFTGKFRFKRTSEKWEKKTSSLLDNGGGGSFEPRLCGIVLAKGITQIYVDGCIDNAHASNFLLRGNSILIFHFFRWRGDIEVDGVLQKACLIRTTYFNILRPFCIIKRQRKNTIISF